MATPTSFTAEPLFYGPHPTTVDKNATLAEDYFDRMDTIRRNANLGDTAAIVRFVGNFRGDMVRWWKEDVQSSSMCNFDQTYLNTNWDYFSRLFKRVYFKVRDQSDTISDISDLKQKPKEEIYHYFSRCISAMNPLAKMSLIYTFDVIMHVEPLAMAQPELLAFLRDPAANPFINERAALDSLLRHSRACLEHGATLRQRHELYEKVAGNVATHARDEKMRLFLREQLFSVDRCLETLREKAVRKEHSFRPTTFLDNKIVAEICVDEDDETLDGVEFSASIEEIDADDDVDIAAIDAKTKKLAFLRKKKVAANAKGGKGKQQRYPPKQESASDKAKHNDQFKCVLCRVDSHLAKECRKLRRCMGMALDGPLLVGPPTGRPGGQSGGAGKYNKFANKNRQQQQQPQQQQFAAPEPMDMSAMTTAVQQMAPPVDFSQHQQWRGPPMDYSYNHQPEVITAIAAGRQFAYTQPPPTFYRAGNE
jgi:hypothetical protein